MEQPATHLLVTYPWNQGLDRTWSYCPEQRPYALWVDGLLRSDWVPWMVDHLRLTRDERIAPWIMENQKYLESTLDRWPAA